MPNSDDGWKGPKYWDSRKLVWRELGDHEGGCERCLEIIAFYDENHSIEDCIKSLAERGRPRE